MQEYLFGRLTTLNKLRLVRNNGAKSWFIRAQADRQIRKIVAQLKDTQLMAYRVRLIKAVRAYDQHEQWKLENLIRRHERAYDNIEAYYYSERHEDSL